MRHLIALLAAVASVVALTGCDTANEPNPDPTSTLQTARQAAPTGPDVALGSEVSAELLTHNGATICVLTDLDVLPAVAVGSAVSVEGGLCDGSYVVVVHQVGVACTPAEQHYSAHDLMIGACEHGIGDLIFANRAR
jgi:hypothetical protein